MKNEGVFKTAVVGGFDKNSVLDYIKQIDRKVKNNEDKLTKKIEDLHEKNKEAAEKNKELTQSLQILQKEIQDKTEENNNIKAQVEDKDREIEEMRRENIRLNELLDKAQRDLTDQIKKHRDLVTKYDSEIEKSRKYEDSVMQIGTAMLEAQNKADVIILEAKGKIAKMNSDTENTLKVAASKLDDFKYDVNNLKSIIQGQMSGLMDRVTEIDEAIETVQNRFINYFMDTKNAIEAETKKYLDDDKQ